MAELDGIETFIARWSNVTGTERANYQLFITELCALLDVPGPGPAHAEAGETAGENAYVFERRITFAHGDGQQSFGFIDCYRRGAFVLEAKKVKAGAGSKGFDDALLRARTQAENYARALPAADGRPPFVVVVDVGNVIELYAEFTRSGATYTPFPDPRSHRLPLARLRDEAVRQRLRTLWLDPMALDPSRVSAQVTRDVATKLALLSRDLEAEGHGSEHVAAFLTRCLFSMFAEDVGLLPKAANGEGAFVHLLRQYREDPDALRHLLRALWTDMDRGGFSIPLAKPVLRFNGKLFKGHGADAYVLPLNKRLISGLLGAAESNWREVEPAIIGTLLERALDPKERHALGAHYTPRAYVERLVLPTVVEPLRADWANAQAAALLLATEAHALDGKKRDDKMAEARAEVRRFHHQLCTTRVLDPACGSGNFLYVTLEHLKRLEGEVFNQLDELGDTQGKLGLEGETVTPQQLLGIEINERAAALAELVLWIGYLQWHLRATGSATVAEPVIHDYGNIEHRDAVLAYDGQEPMRSADGQLVQRWDGVSFKTHPATGAAVPDETALVPQWRYLNPRAAAWPKADFIVGNPPFIGNKRMREALGDGYVEALRGAWPSIPESADLVMFWWQKAADVVRQDGAKRFGLITTNSITMIFNRRIVDAHLRSTPALHLAFAVPDHPWVDSAGGAAVRIAMTVGAPGLEEGRLLESIEETEAAEGEVAVRFNAQAGVIHANLKIGANVGAARPLQANRGIAFRGVTLLGEGFWVDSDDELVRIEPAAVKPLRNGRDIVDRPRNSYCVDLFGLSEAEARERFPHSYQRLVDRVLPERRVCERRSYREKWWLFAEPRAEFRSASSSLPTYLATSMTAKHRIFVRLSSEVRPDQGLVAICLGDQLSLGVLSSLVHGEWSLVAGGRLGIGNDPRYNQSRCFEPFPFPHDDTGLTPELTTRIRALAEQLDAHRKAQQAAHPELTLTGMYNVLEKLRRAEPLNAKDKLIHTQGLVSVLKSLHDELDAAVLAAYGWHDLQTALTNHTQAEARAAAVETLLERLVALNARRAAEEAAGAVRWLRPDFQCKTAGSQTALEGLAETEAEDTATPVTAAAPAAPAVKTPWPVGLPEQIKAVAEVLASSGRALSLPDLEARFTARGRWRDRLPTILDTLEALGRARRVGPSADRWQAA